jgi:hypothetical protein
LLIVWDWLQQWFAKESTRFLKEPSALLHEVVIA